MFNARGIELIEVIDSELSVGLASLQDVVDGNQNAVGDGGSSLVPATPSSNAVELGVKVTGLCTNARPGDLAHDRPQPHIPAVHRGLHSLARALLVTWTETSPRSQVTCAGEAAHVRSDLGQDGSRRNCLDARDRLQQLERFFEGRKATLDLGL